MKRTMVLKDTPFAEVKREALQQAQDAHLLKTGKRLTQEMIHVRTGIPLSNINRYFNDAEYNPSPENIVLICRAMENYIMIDWLAAQCGGFFISRGQAAPDARTNIIGSVDRIQRGVSDMLSATLEAMKDGTITAAEVRQMAELFRNMAKISEESLAAAEEAGKKGM